MAAADSLARANVSFLVLEASNRTGGRSRAVEFGNPSVGRFVFEQGSNWVSGAGGGSIPKGKGAPQSPAENPVFTLAKKEGIQMVRIPGSSNNMSNYYAVYDTKGVSADPVGALRHWANSVYDCLNHTASTLSSRKLWNAREGLKKCGWRPQTDEEWTVDWALTVDDPGYPARLQSLHAILPDNTYSFFGPDDWFVIDQHPRGFARMIDGMVRDSVPDGDKRVVFNAHVIKIAWDCGGVKVSTKDGQTFGAKEVISTLPLGVLQKKHKDIFEPNLPDTHDKVLIADGIIMANLTHVLLQFPHVWWDNSLPRWLSSNVGGQQASGEFTEWQNLNHESFVPGSQTLLSFLGDPQSTRYEGMSDEDAKAAAMSRLRQQNPSITIPEPTDFFISRHGYDPLSYGAYSGNLPAWRDRFYSTLTEPLQACGTTRVRFGGEAMCDNLSGFTHGGYQSGKELAAQYLYEMGKGPNPKHDDALQLCNW
eukprot:gnl/MRDRNA2_/MRDRNA2_120884_c0_seq1.p1 gnl/MRDRNA2_/MRDRNA2_120884_c0~~gnl/MRDRNA2_/MRDRNA2_120884_c0_seq1.p1  ORF type:complete len:550 (-),score=89.79 gnl/MRDRNA2_/MRDRNA2_120884_c0_seq1:103-1539(-)